MRLLFWLGWLRWLWWRAVKGANTWLGKRRGWASRRSPRLAKALLKAIDAVDWHYGRHIVWRLELHDWKKKQPRNGEPRWRASSRGRLLVLLGVAVTLVVLLFLWQIDDKPVVHWLALYFLHAVTGKQDIDLPNPEWRDFGPALIALVGAPFAILFWFWRDVHARATIENNRKDTNLKEFQEVQMRAAGALDEKLPAAARETLQIAAIHQLRGFIHGDYGEAFRRPAFELLRARLEISARERGDDVLSDKLAEWQKKIQEAMGKPKPLKDLISELCELIEESRRNQRTIFDSRALHQSEYQLLIEDWNMLFCSGLPLRGMNLSLIQFERRTVFARSQMPLVNLHCADLAYCHFQGVNLQGARLDGADLRGANLRSANLMKAQMQSANLINAQLQVINLLGSQLQGANLTCSRLQGANLSHAQLQYANLSHAQLKGVNLSCANLLGTNLASATIDSFTNLENAFYDDNTIFGYLNDSDPQTVEQHRKKWCAQGARHVNELTMYPSLITYGETIISAR